MSRDLIEVRVDILDDFIPGHFPVEKTERRVRKRVHHADKGIAGVGTAAGGDPQAVSFRVLLEGGLKMFRVLDEIPAHVEKEPCNQEAIQARLRFGEKAVRIPSG